MTYHVSVTGLSVTSPLQMPLFWWHAVRAMQAAQAHPDCLMAEARTINGVQHTLSVWTSRAAMRAYLVGPGHGPAMRAMPRIGTGHTTGYASETLPDWADALAHWRAARPDTAA